MKKLGEKIWRLRERRGLSQEALAEKLEVSRQTISNWENDRATPDAYKLKQLCKALGVSVDELWETGERKPDPEGKQTQMPLKDTDIAERKKGKGQVWKIPVLSVLGVLSVLLLAVAIVLFTLPEEEKTQVITSAFTFTPTMGGIILLVLAAFLLVAVAVILSKRK